MIYDCFTFFNELDLLEIRLNVLNNVVDKFILVEMNKTHSNNDKAFYFEENKERYAEFLDKIIHIKVSDCPSKEKFSNMSDLQYSWLLENYQRNAILRGLTEVQPTDFIIISDLDEIPKPEIVASYDSSGIWVFEQKMIYYYLNCLSLLEPIWCGTRMGTMKDFFEQEVPENAKKELFQKALPCSFRLSDGKRIPHAGWHFSYLGGAEAIINKIKSFAHQEHNIEENLTVEKITKKIENGQDLFGREELKFNTVKLDNSFPKYIVGNQEKYKHLIKKV